MARKKTDEQKLNDIVQTSIKETLTIKQSGKYRVIENIFADVNNNLVDAKTGSIIDLTDWEAKILKNYIEEI